MSKFQLRIVGNACTEKIFLLSNEGKQTFGREKSCDHWIADPFVSRRQFEVMPRMFTVQNSSVLAHLIVDLNSQHETRLNGVPIETATLCCGDTVQIGITRMMYERASQCNRIYRLAELKFTIAR